MRECSSPECSNDEMKTRCTLKVCGRCKANREAEPAVYCSPECQAAHYPQHKQECKVGQPRKPIREWADAYRLCHDGSSHFGDLELITWEGLDSELEYKKGWGGALLEEVDWLKDRFVNELQSSRSKLLECQQGAYRWTCCGMTADEGIHGCDHHGDPRAAKSCKCDFCRAGQPVPQDMYDQRQQSQAAKGLTLRRGPDARAHSAAGMFNFCMREALGF